MKILSITAGAAGMYCGSCFRDNALAAELLAQGHDVTLMPVYTPTRTDEVNVSQSRVLFGGLSVYLQQRFPLFRHGPRLFDRLLDAPSVIRALTARSVKTDPRLLGDLTVSMLEGEHGVLRREFDKLVEWMKKETPPDVINLPNSLLIAMAAPLRKALGRPVCCTLQGEELFLGGLMSPWREQARTLIQQQVCHVDRFIAVSEYCARFMTEFLAIPPSRVSVVPLGIQFDGYGPLPPGDGVFRVGYFARIAPEKGLRELADAYVRFRRRTGAGRARLQVAGYMAAGDRPYLDEVKRTLAGAGLLEEFSCRGEVDRAGKLAFLAGLDVLSVPATYDEPKGLFLLEAMASGVPVVQPRRGAFTEIVERTGGGVLVDADDAESLADGLFQLWSNRADLTQLGRQAFDGVRAHYTIGESARRQVEVYTDVIAGATAEDESRKRLPC